MEYHHNLTKFKTFWVNWDSPDLKRLSALSGLRKLLQKLHSQNGWQHHSRIERNLRFSKQGTQWCMPTHIETTHSGETTSPIDRCRLQERRLHPHDWRQSRPKNPIKEIDLRVRWVSVENFVPRTIKDVELLERILAIYMAFFEFPHILWEATKPTIVLTDNKSVTRFFQTRATPPSLWNACDYVLHSNFKRAHVAGSVNTAADFLSKLELKVTEKIHLKIREDLPTTPNEVTTSSSDVADEEQFFFMQTDGQDEAEEQILQREEQSREKEAEWVVNQEPSSMKPSIKEFSKIDGNTTSYSLHEIKANAQISVEQDAGLVLKNLKLKILGQPHDDVLLTTDRRIKYYKANEGRIILKDGLLFRKYYGKTGGVKYYQILIPNQLVNEVLRNLHGEIGKHPGITKTIHAYREKYYYPNMAQLIREWVMSSDQCLEESPINLQLTCLPLQNPKEYMNTLVHQKTPWNWLSTGITAVRWIWKHCYSHGCVFPLLICWPKIKSRRQNNH